MAFLTGVVRPAADEVSALTAAQFAAHASAGRLGLAGLEQEKTRKRGPADADCLA